MNIALQFKWRDKSRATNVVPGVKPGSVYMHGLKPRLELNGPELASFFFWGGGGS